MPKRNNIVSLVLIMVSILTIFLYNLTTRKYTLFFDKSNIGLNKNIPLQNNFYSFLYSDYIMAISEKDSLVSFTDSRDKEKSIIYGHKISIHLTNGYISLSLGKNFSGRFYLTSDTNNSLITLFVSMNPDSLYIFRQDYYPKFDIVNDKGKKIGRLTLYMNSYFYKNSLFNDLKFNTVIYVYQDKVGLIGQGNGTLDVSKYLKNICYGIQSKEEAQLIFTTRIKKVFIVKANY